MAARLGIGRKKQAAEYAGVATPMALVMWLAFAGICWCIMPFYARVSSQSPDVIRDVVTYGRIVCLCSTGLFLESVWTKVHQANGEMCIRDSHWLPDLGRGLRPEHRHPHRPPPGRALSPGRGRRHHGGV